MDNIDRLIEEVRAIYDRNHTHNLSTCMAILFDIVEAQQKHIKALEAFVDDYETRMMERRERE